jgi:nucleotide-binding universal stress UspA family protein
MRCKFVRFPAVAIDGTPIEPRVRAEDITPVPASELAAEIERQIDEEGLVVRDHDRWEEAVPYVSDGSSRAASPEASSHPILPERQHAGRWIVVGYDGSAPAERALLRAADAAGERDAVVIVTTTSRIHSAGAAAEPLLEPSAAPSELLAAAKATVTAHASLADVVLVAREGDPAEELLEVARAASADLVVVGRRGKDFVARTLLGSVATRVVEQAPCDVLVVA